MLTVVPDIVSQLTEATEEYRCYCVASKAPHMHVLCKMRARCFPKCSLTLTLNNSAFTSLMEAVRLFFLVCCFFFSSCCTFAPSSYSFYSFKEMLKVSSEIAITQRSGRTSDNLTFFEDLLLDGSLGD